MEHGTDESSIHSERERMADFSPRPTAPRSTGMVLDDEICRGRRGCRHQVVQLRIAANHRLCRVARRPKRSSDFDLTLALCPPTFQVDVLNVTAISGNLAGPDLAHPSRGRAACTGSTRGAREVSGTAPNRQSTRCSGRRASLCLSRRATRTTSASTGMCTLSGISKAPG